MNTTLIYIAIFGPWAYAVFTQTSWGELSPTFWIVSTVMVCCAVGGWIENRKPHRHSEE
jgi:hypothetical protein